MEKRLIDANALAKWLDKEHYVDKPTGKCDERQNKVLGIAISALKNPQIAHTIDAVPVVRCRECYYRDKPSCCPYQFSGFKVEPDWYCPMGVKKDAKMDGGAS